jgi:flagellin
MSVINTNITSMIGQSNLSKSQNDLQTSMERLSSGLRINSAKDDAAGQAIANRMSAQITGLSTAQRNANDGISVAQTAEGALNQVNDNLQRVRELTVQAQNGTNSQDDLTSIQNEIGQRLNEINRISEETEFNGVKVLQEDNSLKIQVGANDGQQISIDLKNINAQTLGLDGFNVDGTGVTQNKAATVTDLTAAGATGTGPYTVTTTHKAASFTDVMANVEDGNSVNVDGTVYTYSADSESFTFDDTLDTTAGADVTALADKLAPATGTKSGTYELDSGDTAAFEVDATGNLTLDGQAAYISATGELTNNNPGGGSTQATLEDLLTDMGGQAGAKLNIDGTQYERTAADTITFKATATSADVETAVAGATAASATLGSGITSATVNFTAGSTDSSDTYVDGDNELTTVQTYNTEYKVDANNGEVTVSGGTGTDKYAAEVGAQAFVNSDGELTTETTSEGDKTENPLSALDSALSTVDSLRSDLGAIQNRFESAITNLSTTETNLSAARSRIEDADYAVEVANMTRAQILQQAGTSVLAQANQLPQNVLSLLG